ncbi:tetratricopeptide repeat protein [Massilia rhizosphaerae]|uniref:tetratricopeptide repeat protein n=1 Tax=Massilia rhizosphaerae TaxID=2784389 RepID=UPI0018DD603D|nr:tetratricopeptide repeat protein [Massilia rhizosphaerae]
MIIRTMRAWLAAALLSILVAGCGRAPLPAEIEAVSMDAVQRGDAAAERRLQAWAGDGLPVAERELALLYRTRHRDDQARALFMRAARQGDAESAWQLGELERERSRDDGAGARAAQWYRQAARQGHARAALGLALLLKNGTGVPVDKAAAAHWLGVAAQAGDAHAMFLLSNAYADGDGVPADPRRARDLLERAADHEYPAAIQQLALVKQTGDALTPKDAAEADQLLKEGAEHRRSNARRF